METAWQNKTLVQKILDRQKEYEELRNPYNDRMADIVDFCDPGLTAWQSGSSSEETEGKFRGEQIYEGTPPWALRTMADGWLGNLVSESLRWLKYLLIELEGNDEVNKWLQELEDYMYYVYRQSELYSALAPYTRAALSVGSPVITPYEDREKGKIKCEVPHPKENYHGPQGNYHRKYKLTVLDAVHKFLKDKLPEDEAENTEEYNVLDTSKVEKSKLSEAIINDYKNGKHTKRHTFIKAIYPSDDPILEGQPKEYRNKPWMEFYIEANQSESEQSKEPILVQGYWTKPHIRWDYEMNTDEFYARTPAWNAMQDIRSGQELAKQMLEAGERSLHPSIWAQRKYKGRINMRPKGFTYYDTADEVRNIPKPIQERINYPIGADIHDRTKTSVERWFYVDLFRILSRLAEQKHGWPTATHIIHLNAEKAILLAPRIGRFTNVLREIDNRFQDIERRAGRLPEPPDIVHELMAYKRLMGEKKLTIDVEFVGPLAQMQQRGLALGRVEAGLAIAERFHALYPNTIYKVRPSVALEKALEQVGFTQDAIVPENEYQQAVAQVAQQEQTDKAMEGLKDAADAVPKLSKTIEPGSPLGAAMEAAQE